jgi:2-oxoglutarate/2-oxoacid ferredoxin oxidoreductase subunit beta
MVKEKKVNLGTNHEITWCPGCYDFMILESVKRAIASLIEEGEKQENFAMTTDIGCSSKIFDYLNISGIYGLHGRAIPTALGLKLGNPNLKVLTFAGDGGTYSEGIGHLIHACRNNSNFTLIVNNNQTFALTTGQSTATTQEGYVSKSEPLGEFSLPINPIKIALASNASFVARTFAGDIEDTARVIKEAIKHNGFSFVEIIQPCLQFNKELIKIKNQIYKIQDNRDDIKKANLIADEWNYNSRDKKVPVGIIYQQNRKTLEEEWPQLKKLLDKKILWKNLEK